MLGRENVPAESCEERVHENLEDSGSSTTSSNSSFRLCRDEISRAEVGRRSSVGSRTVVLNSACYKLKSLTSGGCLTLALCFGTYSISTASCASHCPPPDYLQVPSPTAWEYDDQNPPRLLRQAYQPRHALSLYSDVREHRVQPPHL